MPVCSVLGCRNSGVHLFPKDPILRRKWEKAIRREKHATDFLRLCRDHFKDSDYVGISAYTGRPQVNRYLKKGVIPSIFPWNQNHKSSTASSLNVQNQENIDKVPWLKICMTQDVVPAQNYLQENINIKNEEMSTANKPILRNKKPMFISVTRIENEYRQREFIEDDDNFSFVINTGESSSEYDDGGEDDDSSSSGMSGIEELRDSD